MNPLSPCPDCDRHYRIDESACPFCSSKKRKPSISGVLGAAALTLALTGCPSDRDSMVMEYGAPPPQDRDVQPEYGAPPAKTAEDTKTEDEKTKTGDEGK